MLSFLARTLLILAAAFGLGAIGGRATRRRGPARAVDPRSAADRSQNAAGETASDGHRDAEPGVLLAGAIAGETGSDIGGSNMLAGSSARSSTLPPAKTPSSAADEEPTGKPASAVANPASAATDGAGAMSDDPADVGEPQAAFASYGGSGVSAGFERVGEPSAGESGTLDASDGRPLRARSRWSDEASTGISTAATAVSDGAEATNVSPPELTLADIDEPTPSSEASVDIPGDVLAEKHRSESFDKDFRALDYGNLNKDARPPTLVGTVAPDDGWTVPEDGGPDGQEVFEESHAAFRSGGGSAPIRGAPEDEPAASESDPGLVASQFHAAPGPETVPDGSPHSTLGPVATAAAPAARGLDAARDGRPDDLTRISGIGPSIERLLFENGIFHFDQIAAWTEADVRWADTLTGFRGRVIRERWIDQAVAFDQAKT